MFGKQNRFYFASVLSQYVNIVVSALTIFIILPLLIEINGIYKYGDWSKIFIPISFSGLVTTGLSNAITKSLNTDGFHKARAIFGFGAIWVVFVSIVIIAALHTMVFFGHFLTSLYQHDTNAFLGASIVIIICGGFIGVLHGYLRYFLKDYVISLTFGLQTLLIYSLAYYSSCLSLSFMYWSVAVSLLVVLIITVIYTLSLVQKLKTKQDLTFFQFNETSVTKNFRTFGLIGFQNSINQPFFRLIIEGSLNSSVYAAIDLGLKLIHLFEGLISSLSAPLFSLWDGKHVIKTRGIVKNLILINLGILILGISIFFMTGNVILTYFDETLVDYLILMGISIFVYNLMAVVEPINRWIWSDKSPIVAFWLRSGIFPLLMFFSISGLLQGANLLIAYSLPFALTSLIFVWYSER